MPRIPALGKQRQGVQGQPILPNKFQDNQSYTLRPCLKRKKRKKDFSIQLDSQAGTVHTCNPSIWKVVQDPESIEHTVRLCFREEKGRKKMHMEFNSVARIGPQVNPVQDRQFSFPFLCLLVVVISWDREPGWPWTHNPTFSLPSWDAGVHHHTRLIAL